jgi:ATP-dependent exoDNAse (exonuclease V) beta subunit
VTTSSDPIAAFAPAGPHSLPADLADRPARELIRGALDRNMVVEAAAGTGKTTELVHRIVAVVAEGRAGVHEIVAVTFTEKAAGELKLRMRGALEKARRNAPDERRRQNIEQALQHLEEARVSTIHGFCADLLRERPVEAGVDPEFAVMTEAESERLYEEAFGRWLEQTLSNPPEGVRRSLRRRTAESPIERLKRAGYDLLQWRDFATPWTRPAFSRRSAIEEVAVRLLAFAAMTDSPLKKNDTLFRDTEPARVRAAAIRDERTLRGIDHDELEAELVALSRNRDFEKARKGSGAQYAAGVTRDEVLAAHAALVNALRDLRLAADADLAALLQQELRGVIDRYQELKLQSGRLDFDDLLVRTRDLLCKSDEVRASLQARFSAIFVDEFQDTDPLQAEILLLLAADDPSVRTYHDAVPAPGKLFIVGDPKQAIYRFRRADLGIYQAVKTLCAERGALLLSLSVSFRSVPAIQTFINAAFAPVMTGNPVEMQAGYVPLLPSRRDRPEQPAVVALPVPKPYGKQKLSMSHVGGSVPGAVGAFIDWLIRKSGFVVSERDREVPIAARHICLLFRQFERFGEDLTRPYIEALEARGIPHVLVGGRSFYAREEVETMIAALSAIEWPDDELNVFATLRGSLFAIGDSELFEVRHRHGPLHPLRRILGPWEERHQPIADALAILASLHRQRNHLPVSDTIHRLLQETRALAGFALRPSGERALANVLHLSDLARSYEASGGLSFRGFIDQLRQDAEAGKSPEAPILEEGGDGVRLMTVHKAKGLEFPAVVLADITAKIGRLIATRTVDRDRLLCAMRLADCSPWDLLEREEEELLCDRAEGARIAYVAATRARDLLIVPAVGDAPDFPEHSWIGPLHAALSPGAAAFSSADALRCPPFGADSVVERPPGDGPCARTVRPGRYTFDAGYQVVWWDPHTLDLDRAPVFGVRREDLLGKDAPAHIVETDRKAYLDFYDERTALLLRGQVPRTLVSTATQLAAIEEGEAPIAVTVVELPRPADRPSGARFGTLVHAVLATVDLTADTCNIAEIATLQGRILGATAEEVSHAVRAAESALAHPLLERARIAAKNGKCRRETPVSIHRDSTLIEGVIDLAFHEDGCWTVVDFKTDRDLAKGIDTYRRQIGIYAAAIARATGDASAAVLLCV